MKTRLEQVLDRQLGDRRIVLWGDATRLLLRAIARYPLAAADRVDPNAHYVVAVREDDLADFLMDDRSEPFRYVDDYLTFYDFGGELPFEWTCCSAKIGRQTYFGDSFVSACEEGIIQSIGHFTSINGTAQIHVDHQRSMSFVSDEVQRYFSDENAAHFQRECSSDPKHPYAMNKERVAIGHDVWIGANAFVNASKVRAIGDGAIIGAGAVVLEDVPPYAVIAGVPAKVKRFRYAPEMIEVLQRVQWWHWSADEINAQADALMSPEIFMERFR